MDFPIFELERVQSLHENTVEINLTESGVHPLTLAEVLTAEQLAALHGLGLGYGQTNGPEVLRRRIAALYPDLGSDNVLVTNGSAEANFVACHTLLEPGDEVVVMQPNYQQIWGIAETIGARPVAFHLQEADGWAPDLDELRRVVGPRTRMIAVCNPSNPTGAVLGEEAMKTIVEVAESVGAWIHADEVYRGAELEGPETPTFVGLTERVTAVAGLSKAYALPGLRLGWLAGPAATVATAWAYHDYTSIAAGILSHRVAAVALSPEVRPRILERTRRRLRTNLEVLDDWVAARRGRVRFTPPRAGGMAFLRYDFPVGSTALSDWLRTEHGVFVLAGDCFGMDAFIRIGIGADRPALVTGLDRVGAALEARFGNG